MGRESVRKRGRWIGEGDLADEWGQANGGAVGFGGGGSAGVFGELGLGAVVCAILELRVKRGGAGGVVARTNF